MVAILTSSIGQCNHDKMPFGAQEFGTRPKLLVDGDGWTARNLHRLMSSVDQFLILGRTKSDKTLWKFHRIGEIKVKLSGQREA